MGRPSPDGERVPRQPPTETPALAASHHHLVVAKARVQVVSPSVTAGEAGSTAGRAIEREVFSKSIPNSVSLAGQRTVFPARNRKKFFGSCDWALHSRTDRFDRLPRESDAGTNDLTNARIFRLLPAKPRSMSTDLAAQKQALREQAFENRKAQDNKDELSRQIVAAFMALPEYASAKTVLFYVDARSEVRTRFDLPNALVSGKKIVVPWCNDAGELELFHLVDPSELAVGMYKILEPREDLRRLPEKQVPVAQLDLVMVPGVAFDDRGGRMGHGKGYYDKLLENARPDCPLVALAFECQIFPEVPMGDHDIFMDKVITEKRVIEGRGRK